VTDPVSLIPSLKICKGKAVPVLLTDSHAMKAYWGSRDIVPRILNLGTRWR
jgi:hypothetical protein